MHIRKGIFSKYWFKWHFHVYFFLSHFNIVKVLFHPLNNQRILVFLSFSFSALFNGTLVSIFLRLIPADSFIELFKLLPYSYLIFMAFLSLLYVYLTPFQRLLIISDKELPKQTYYRYMFYMYFMIFLIYMIFFFLFFGFSV